MPPNVLNRIKIFLIENHHSLRSLLAGFLEAQGARVFTYSVTTDAIADLTRESPDLVLLDLIGAEVPGLQLLKQIPIFDWESGRDTPVLAIGRLANIVGHRRASVAGFYSYLEIPFSPNQLMHAIKSALNFQS
jgi:DNA-binding NtrC family response regulator